MASDAWAFVHIPRTGGTAFAAVYGRGDWEGLHKHAPAAAFPGRRKVTVIRNPWDRAVSVFCYHNRNRDHSIARFQTWVAGGCHYDDHLGLADRVMRAWDPQIFWLTGNDAIEIVRFEHYWPDWERWLARAGVEDRGRPPVRNSFTPGPWLQYYDKQAFDQVAEIYAEDCRLWAELQRPCMDRFIYQPGQGLVRR